jgi:hypothetical protein
MATIKCNTEELKMSRTTAYGTLFNDTLDEYEANMRERFDEEVALVDYMEEYKANMGERFLYDDYIQECRYFEVNFNENTEYEALEAIGTNCNAVAVSRMIMGMNKAVIDYHEENGLDIDTTALTELGKLYTTWRCVVTSDVVWTIEEEEED